MDALHGLSALAAEMPRLQTEEQARRTLRMKSSVAAASAPKPQISSEATEALYPNAPHASATLLPLRKRPFDVDIGIPATNLTTVDARATTVTIDEGSLLRLELARRASLGANRLSTAPAPLPHIYERSVISSINRLPVALPGFATTVVAMPVAAIAPPSQVLHGRHPLQLHDSHRLLPGSQFDAFLLHGSGYPSSHAAHPSIGPRPMFGVPATSAPSADLLSQARAFEFQAHACWLNAAQQQARQQQQQMLIQGKLYQEKLYQEKLLGHTHTAVPVGFQPPLPAVSYSYADAVALGRVLPNGLTLEDMMAVLEQSKVNAMSATQPSREWSQQPSRNYVELSAMESNFSQLVASQEQVTSDIAQVAQQPTNNDADDNPQHLNTLSLPTDSNFLTEAHCFLRSTCIEIFVSTDEDVNAPGKVARPFRAGQVGFRCIHCKHIPRGSRANQAVGYPSKRETIFESVRNFQRVHFNACPHTSESVKQRYMKVVRRGRGLKRSKKLVRAYYAQAASEVGLIDTPRGLEHRDNRTLFVRTGSPSQEMKSILLAAQAEEASSANGALSSTYVLEKKSILASGSNTTSVVDQNIKYGKFDGVVSDCTKQVIENARKETTPFVLPQDFPTVSDYLFLLFHQLLPCKPTTATIKRRRLDPNQLRGIPGLCCKHCHQNDGISGMYFPLNIDSLGDSSFSQTLMMHLSICSFIDPEIKNALLELHKLTKEYNSSVKRGSKKSFMEKVWTRMEDISMGVGESEGGKDEDKIE